MNRKGTVGDFIVLALLILFLGMGIGSLIVKPKIKIIDKDIYVDIKRFSNLKDGWYHLGERVKIRSKDEVWEIPTEEK
jgi:hypothetical protein